MASAPTSTTRRRKVVAAPSPYAWLAEELRRALARLGGEAHRDLVIGEVAMTTARPRPVLREDLIEIFEQEAARGTRALGVQLAHRFGPGSHRWQICGEFSDQSPA